MLASPPSSVNGAGTILAACPCLPNKGGDPVLAEEASKLAVRVGINKVTNNTHGGSHQSLAPAARVLRDDVKKLENRLDEGLQLGYLRSALVGQEDTTPGIHDTLTERDNVVEHLNGDIVAGGNGRGLLENLGNDRQVGVELSSDSLGNVAKCLENGGLELVGGASEVVEQVVHEGVAEGLDLLVQCACNVANQANGHGAETKLLLVAKSVVQEGTEGLHVLDEVFLESASNSTNGSEHNIRNTRLGRNGSENLEHGVHDAVGLGLDLRFETLNNGKNDTNQASLHLFQGDAVLDADNLGLHGNSLLETLEHDIRQSGNHGQAVVGSICDERVENFVSSSAELVVSILSLSESKKRLDALLEVPRKRVGLSANFTGEAVGNVHQSPAAGAGNLGSAGKTIEEARDQGLEVNLGVEGLRAEVAHTTQGESSRVANLDGAVLHHTNENAKRLLDQGLQDLGVGTVHDGTEGSNGGITTAPVFIANVLLDKLQNGLHHLTLDTLSVELQCLVGSAGDVVLVLASVLILLAHVLQEDGDNLSACDTSKAKEGTDVSNTFGLSRSIVILDRNFLFTDCAPEFNGKLGNILLLALHTHNAETKQSLLHVEAHLLVVRAHDTVETAKGTGLDTEIVGLGSLADNLHDVIPLTLILHVGPNKVDRITQSGHGGIPHVHVGLLATGTLDDGGEDGIRLGSQAFPELGVLGFADIPNGDQGGLLELIGAGSDVLNEGVHEFRPLIAGQFDGSDGDDELSGGGGGTGILGSQCLKGKLLNLSLDFGADLLNPPPLHFA